MTVVQTYAPINDAMDEQKNESYNQLQDTISDCNRNDVIAMIGDLNAKVGNNITNRKEVVRKFGIGSGERLYDFCSANGFIITGTHFPHKDNHKLTCGSPSKPDSPCSNEWKYENIYLDTRVMRGTVYSDHYLVTTRICLKLARAEGRKNVRERFDVSKLPSEEIKRKHNTEARNRFGALGDIDDLEEEHDMILATCRDGAKRVLGWSKKLSRPWIGSKTSEKVKERKEAKLKLEGARSK